MQNSLPQCQNPQKKSSNPILRRTKHTPQYRRLMKFIFTTLLVCLSALSFAHNGTTHDPAALRLWSISNQQPVSASFMMLKDQTVYFETADERIVRVPLTDLTTADQSFVAQKQQKIEVLNHQTAVKSAFPIAQVILLLLLVVVVSFTYFAFVRQSPYRYALASVGVLVLLLGFTKKPILGTDPLFIDSAFAPFKPNVKTHWDNQYFYVEDLGMPTHPMMKGITAWQQQVPIPQCYVGTNAWSIPLNPVVAATPVPTATNFFKGAVALAANGIPIFNAYNNRGEDSYLLGELDQYGGHCGRADDYHYHIAPLSLDSITSAILPIAFALDGFAVYAAKEPNGTPMTALDANHGHYFNGVYHYHGTSNYPYVVGSMVGVVTKDATDQIIPQAQTKAIRTAGTPLAGAVITNHEATGLNAYKLTYTLNNQSYDVNYSWTSRAIYTYVWGSPTGTTTNTYTGQLCSLSTDVDDLWSDNAFISVFPNPSHANFTIKLNPPLNVQAIESLSLFDATGKKLFYTEGYQSEIATQHLANGIYFLKVRLDKTEIVKKVIIEK
ncbi:MAG: YHYH protein [Saprospiraceae bacterium]|nr:YHYH protein [Saprospiraceae bacterium]